jgi:hypothetical protein
MTWITGAKMLAERIGAIPAEEPAQIPADAPALFHWCNVSPGAPLAPVPGRARDEPIDGARSDLT